MIVVTLTSWTKRIYYIKQVVESIMNNTIQPDRVYLNLSKTEFDGIELPDDLVEYFNSDDRLILNWVEGDNTKSMKKIFPILEYLEDDDIIINADDDILFPVDLIESRIKDFEKYDKKYSITSHTDYVDIFGCMYVAATLSLYTKRMFNYWYRFVDDDVIGTYDDDRTYLYILWFNGYLNKPCSKYDIFELCDKHNLRLDDTEMHFNNGYIYGRYYDSVVYNRVYQISDIPLNTMFGYFNTMSDITFVIPNRGGKHIDFVIRQLRKFYPNEKYIVVNQEDDESFKRGQLFNSVYKHIHTDYICFVDNDSFFKEYIDLIGIYKETGCQVLMPLNRLEQVEVVNDDEYNIIGETIIKWTPDFKYGCMGVMNFVSRKTFEELNGFSNLLSGYGNEDNEFANRCEPGKFITIDNAVCHIKHPTRNIHDIHQELNHTLYNSVSGDICGGIDTTISTEIYSEERDGVLYIGLVDISTSNEETLKLLQLHKPDKIREACTYISNFYLNECITNDYVLVGVSKVVEKGDDLILEAELELLDRLPYKRLGSYFINEEPKNMNIGDDDIIVFSSGYFGHFPNETMKYLNIILESFPNNKIVFLPNDNYFIDSYNIEYFKLIDNLKSRNDKTCFMSTNKNALAVSRKYLKCYSNVLCPNVLLTFDIKKYIDDNNCELNYYQTNKSLFIDTIKNNNFFDCTEWKSWDEIIEHIQFDNESDCNKWRANNHKNILKTIEYINSFDEIYSNKLCGVILSWLLGKKTYCINEKNCEWINFIYNTWLYCDKNIINI